MADSERFLIGRAIAAAQVHRPRSANAPLPSAFAPPPHTHTHPPRTYAHTSPSACRTPPLPRTPADAMAHAQTHTLAPTQPHRQYSQHFHRPAHGPLSPPAKQTCALSARELSVTRVRFTSPLTTTTTALSDLRRCSGRAPGPSFPTAAVASGRPWPFDEPTGPSSTNDAPDGYDGYGAHTHADMRSKPWWTGHTVPHTPTLVRAGPPTHACERAAWRRRCTAARSDGLCAVHAAARFGARSADQRTLPSEGARCRRRTRSEYPSPARIGGVRIAAALYALEQWILLLAVGIGKLVVARAGAGPHHCRAPRSAKHAAGVQRAQEHQEWLVVQRCARVLQLRSS